MATMPRLYKPLRTLHLYVGVFIAPALLFFAFTGALQSLGLHEAAHTSGYRPPAWLVSLSHLHKKQSLEVPVRHRPQRQRVVRRGGRAPVPLRNPWPMKIFFVFVAFGLAFSALTGLYIGWRHTRAPVRYGGTLAAGIVVPILLLLI